MYVYLPHKLLGYVVAHQLNYSLYLSHRLGLTSDLTQGSMYARFPIIDVVLYSSLFTTGL